MRRFLLVIPLAFALLFAGAAAPAAAAEWCDTDPLVLIATPGGALVPVYVTTGALGVEHLPAVLAASIAYTAQPVASGTATLVHLEVVVPDDAFDAHFPTRTVASTGPLATGTIYASAEGFSGTRMATTFTLDVP